jgi:SAM-dependent methyltransferase
MQLKNAIKNINRSITIFYKTSFLHKFLYFLAFLVCVSLITNYKLGPGLGQGQIEGFESGAEPKTNEFKMKENITDIYDDFYVEVYDDLVYSKGKNEYEIVKLKEYTQPVGGELALDIGSGTGHHVNRLLAHGYKAQGIDVSPSMIKKAHKNYPELKFEQADALDNMLFVPESFSYITCLYFTLYYIQDKRKIFENCMKWLAPGGFLAVHLVNRDKFDPIIPAGNPFTIVSPQKFAKKRITSTIVKFNDFEYKSNFNMKNDVNGENEPNALMVETFTNYNDGNIRKNEHKLYMQTQAEILDIAKSAGFIIHSKIDLLKCQYDSQYVYILQKPT